MINYTSIYSLKLIFRRNSLIHALGKNETDLYISLIEKLYYYDENDKLFDGGWFFSTVADMYDSTALNEYSQRKAIKNLIKAGLIEMKVSGLPARRFFRVCEDITRIQMYLSLGENIAITKKAKIEKTNTEKIIARKDRRIKKSMIKDIEKLSVYTSSANIDGTSSVKTTEKIYNINTTMDNNLFYPSINIRANGSDEDYCEIMIDKSTEKKVREKSAKKNTRYTELARNIRKYLGLRRKLSGQQMLEVMKWTKAYGLSDDMIIIAADKAGMAEANFPFAYMKVIIENWRNAGVKTEEEVKLYDEEYKATNISAYNKNNVSSGTKNNDYSAAKREELAYKKKLDEEKKKWKLAELGNEYYLELLTYEYGPEWRNYEPGVAGITVPFYKKISIETWKLAFSYNSYAKERLLAEYGSDWESHCPNELKKKVVTDSETIRKNIEGLILGLSGKLAF